MMFSFSLNDYKYRVRESLPFDCFVYDIHVIEVHTTHTSKSYLHKMLIIISSSILSPTLFTHYGFFLFRYFSKTRYVYVYIYMYSYSTICIKYNSVEKCIASMIVTVEIDYANGGMSYLIEFIEK